MGRHGYWYPASFRRAGQFPVTPITPGVGSYSPNTLADAAAGAAGGVEVVQTILVSVESVVLAVAK